MLGVLQAVGCIRRQHISVVTLHPVGCIRRQHISVRSAAACRLH